MEERGSSVTPPTPKYIKQKVLPAHVENNPGFAHLLQVQDPDAIANSKKFIDFPLQIALDDYFDFETQESQSRQHAEIYQEIFPGKERNPTFSSNEYSIYDQMRLRQNMPIEEVGKSAELIRRHTPGGYGSLSRREKIADPQLPDKTILGFGRHEHTGKKYSGDTDMEKYQKKMSGIQRQEQSTKPFVTNFKDSEAEKSKVKKHINYDDLADVHKAVDESNSRTLKEMARTQEAKMKHLEEMLAKEQARTNRQNQIFQNQMESLVKSQLNHSSTVEQLKLKNDNILKFKSVPTTEDYRRFLAKIEPGKVKGDVNPTRKSKTSQRKSKKLGKPGKKSKLQTGQKLSKNRSEPKTSNLKDHSNKYLNPQKIVLREARQPSPDNQNAKSIKNLVSSPESKLNPIHVIINGPETTSDLELRTSSQFYPVAGSNPVKAHRNYNWKTAKYSTQVPVETPNNPWSYLQSKKTHDSWKGYTNYANNMIPDQESETHKNSHEKY